MLPSTQLATIILPQILDSVLFATTAVCAVTALIAMIALFADTVGVPGHATCWPPAAAVLVR